MHAHTHTKNAYKHTHSLSHTHTLSLSHTHTHQYSHLNRPGGCNIKTKQHQAVRTNSSLIVEERYMHSPPLEPGVQQRSRLSLTDSLSIEVPARRAERVWHRVKKIPRRTCMHALHGRCALTHRLIAVRRRAKGGLCIDQLFGLGLVFVVVCLCVFAPRSFSC